MTLRDLVRRRAALAALKEEINAHLDERIAALIADGMPRAEAERAARRAFGNITNIEEISRDVWRMPRTEDLLADARFAFRFLRRSPAFAAVAVLSLAIGVGANIAVFTVINALLLRPLAVNRPDALVAFSRQDETGRPDSLTFQEYTDLSARTSSFVGLIAHSSGDSPFQVGAVAMPSTGERVHSARVSSNFFRVLGVGMAVGRGFVPVDDSSADAERSVVLSYDFWQRRFGGDPSIVGQSVIVFRNVPFTIVGVAARGFRGIEADERTDAWWPLGAVKIAFPDRLAGWSVTVMGRLKPDVTLARARAEAQVAHAAILADEAAASSNWNDARRHRFLSRRLDVVSGRTGVAETLRSQFAQPLYALMASVAAVLLIACINVGGLLLARATARRRELGVRLALGGGRARIVQQLVTENVLLIAIATMGGVAFVPFALRTILSYAPAAAAISLDTAPDLRTLAFLAAVTFAATLIVALLPAMRSTRTLEEALAAGARESGGTTRRSRVHHWLLGSQVALSLTLLVIAGLFVRTLENLRGLDAGFDRKTVVLVTLNGGAATTAIARLVQPALEKVEGVESATFYANLGLLGGGSAMSDCIVDGTVPGASAEVTCALMQVGPRFFETTSTPIVAGRGFSAGDEPPAAQVAIINETMARQYFAGMSALGRRINGKLVVGVARDTRYTSLREPPPRMMYTPVGQGWAVADVRFAVHSSRKIGELTGPIKRAIVDAGVAQPVTAIESLGAIAEATLARERLLAELASGFGLLALLLACIGLYGTVSFAVARRTNEIGTRLALGATRARIVAGLMIEFGTPVGLGAAGGIAATMTTSGLLSRFLFGVAATDTATMCSAMFVLGLAAAAAAFLPARRASRTDALIALRAE